MWVDTTVIYASFTLVWFLPPSTYAHFISCLMGWPHTLVNECYYAIFHCIGYEIHWRKIGRKWCFNASIPLLCIQFFKGGRGKEEGGNLFWQVKTCFFSWTVWWNPQLSAAKNWTASNIVIITLNCQIVCYDAVTFILFNTIICFPITVINLCIDNSQIFVL